MSWTSRQQVSMRRRRLGLNLPMRLVLLLLLCLCGSRRCTREKKNDTSPLCRDWAGVAPDVVVPADHVCRTYYGAIANDFLSCLAVTSTIRGRRRIRTGSGVAGVRLLHRYLIETGGRRTKYVQRGHVDLQKSARMQRG